MSPFLASPLSVAPSFTAFSPTLLFLWSLICLPTLSLSLFCGECLSLFPFTCLISLCCFLLSHLSPCPFSLAPSSLCVTCFSLTWLCALCPGFTILFCLVGLTSLLVPFPGSFWPHLTIFPLLWCHVFLYAHLASSVSQSPSLSPTPLYVTCSGPTWLCSLLWPHMCVILTELPNFFVSLALVLLGYVLLHFATLASFVSYSEPTTPLLTLPSTTSTSLPSSETFLP